MPAGLSREQILNTVSWMARGRRYDRIVALDEFDLETGAQIREHMRIRGMGITASAYYRDKLAMRIGAQESGFLVPEFCRVLNYDELRAYMDHVPGPWLLKPRSELRRWVSQDRRAGPTVARTRRSGRPPELLPAGTIRARRHLSRRLGVSEGKVVFSVAHQYGRPPMQVMHEGGVFTTRTVDRAGSDWAELTALNAKLAPSLGMVRGVTHAEYIKAHADGRFYFLEIAARVGGAFISDLVAASTGVNLWREWARLEVTNLRGEAYELPRLLRATRAACCVWRRPPSPTRRHSTLRRLSTA